jgi:hypothetical protein
MATKKSAATTTFAFTRDNLRELRAEIDGLMKHIGKKYGVSLGTTGCRFNSSEAKFSILATTSIVGANGETLKPANVKAAKDWDLYCAMFGLKKVWMGKTLLSNGKKVKIIGLLPNRRAWPVLVESTQGKELLMRADDVAIKLKAA